MESPAPSAVARRVSIQVPRPFTLAGTVLGYGYYELPPCSWDGAALRRAEAVDGIVSLLEWRETASRSRSAALVTLTIRAGRQLSSAAVAELARRARLILRVDHDLSGFYALCRSEPRFSAIPRLGVGRLLRGTTLFEDTVKAIAWTNTTWPQAVKMIGKIGELGDPCPVASELRAWPPPERILEAGRSYLEKEAKLGYRAAYIMELAERVASGELDIEKIAAIEDSEEMAKALLGVKGVGPASVAYLQAMLGHYDRPVLDSATLGYLAKACFRGRKPSPKEAEKKLAPYGRWKGLVLWFGLWLSRHSETRRA
jgi:DNA-3-methyladenine glycosylase II